MPTPASARALARGSTGEASGVVIAGPSTRPASVPPVGGGGAGVLGVAGVGGGLLGHVLGPDETLDDLERAVASDGGDAARDREILPPERGAGLDLGLDCVETRVDAFGLLDQLVRPLVLLHGGELVMAQAQLLDLGGLLVGGLAGLGMDAPEARGRAPVHLRHRLGPLPAGRELVGGRGELLDGELVQQRRVLEPHTVLVLVGEEVPEHPATGGLVVLDADIAGHGGAGGDPFLRQQALHLPTPTAGSPGPPLVPRSPAGGRGRS